MNRFEALCRLASEERWCWNLCCTTCGHMHFRYGFVELAKEKSPLDKGWLVHSRRTKYTEVLGPLPRHYTEDEKETVLRICSESNISSIAQNCKYPDWLGYLGLVLEHMNTDSETFKLLSSRWASCLSNFVIQDSIIHDRLIQLSRKKGLLNIRDLEKCEFSILNNPMNGKQ